MNGTEVREAEALKHPLYDLRRYAGWLDKDRTSIAVRADIQALDAALDSGRGISSVLLKLDTDIRRLPSGALRPMLRKALTRVWAALEPTSSM